MNETPMIADSKPDAKAEEIVSEMDRPGGQAPKSIVVEGRATSPKTSRKASFRRPRVRRKARALRKQRERNKRYRQRREAAMRTAPDVFDEMAMLSSEGAKAIHERLRQEGLERDAWKDRVRLAMNQRGIQGHISYWFLVYAEHELRVQGIGLGEPRAVDYTLDVLMPQGPMNDETPWYNLVHQ